MTTRFPIVTICELADLSFDYCHRRLSSPRGEVSLTPKQTDVLVFLILHADRPVSIDHIARTVWGHQFLARNATYRQVIRQLRTRLADLSGEVRITYHRGCGYQLVAPGVVAESSSVGSLAEGFQNA